MNNEKLIFNYLILFNLVKNSCSSNLGVSKKLRNLLVCCVGLEIAYSRYESTFPLLFSFRLAHNQISLWIIRA